MQLQHILEKAGLDKHETAIYLSLIRSGEATAGQVARTSGVPRTYTYRVLDELVQKGFVQERASSSIRRFAVTDFEATKRYIEKQQLELYQIQQQAQSITSQLENLANPQAPVALAESLKEQRGSEDFWRLLHSTITREIWVINPPDWWADQNASKEVGSWEKYREKQHIWEKRYILSGQHKDAGNFVETNVIQKSSFSQASLFLIDQYQVQVTNWAPFRALRIESQEMVSLVKESLNSNI